MFEVVAQQRIRELASKDIPGYVTPLSINTFYSKIATNTYEIGDPV